MQLSAAQQQTFRQLAQEHGTPLYVYDTATLAQQAERLLSLRMPYGYQPRYAMKANPHAEILRFFQQKGIGIDASSSYEAIQAIENGIAPDNILVTSQQSVHNLRELIGSGVRYNATSLRQLQLYGEQFPGTSVGVRLNPGIGSGHSKKTDVGGVTSSFGIWHEQLADVSRVVQAYNLTINRIHTHIGSGTDPAVWEEAIASSLELAKQFPDATTVNIGGGFKVARVPEEKDTPMEAVGGILGEKLARFYNETGKKLQLELEPGTFLVANAGMLLAEIDDIVSTGEEGYQFIKLNTGMNDILRPTLYAAQHPITILSEDDEVSEYVVVGHNCESADLLTPAPDDAERLLPRRLTRAAIGDIVAIGGVGAYCASMSAHGYNGFPSAKEIIV